MLIKSFIDPFALRHDGGNSPTADIDWGGFDITNVGDITIDGTFTDGTLSIASGSITSGVNGTFTGTGSFGKVDVDDINLNDNKIDITNRVLDIEVSPNHVSLKFTDTVAGDPTLSPDEGETIDLGASEGGETTAFRNLFLTGSIVVGTMTITSASITDSGGGIDFNDEILETTGQLRGGSLLTTAGANIGTTLTVGGNITLQNGETIVNSTNNRVDIGTTTLRVLGSSARANIDLGGFGGANAVNIFRKNVADDFASFMPGAALADGFRFFDLSTSGENRPVRIYGYPSGLSKKYGQFSIESVDSNPWFQLSTDGTGISIPEITRIGDGGTTNYTEISATGDIKPVGSAFLIFEKASGNGIKVDQATPTFGFADLIGDQFSKNTGGTKPTLTTYNLAVEAWQFSNGDEAFVSYHIPHDYVKGTDIHLHVHWSQNAAGATGGTLDFKYTAIYAKGHNQASGSTFTSTPITATFSSIDINDLGSGLLQYQQHITEVTISAASATGALFDRDDLEPDGVIELTFEMTTTNLTGTPSLPFIHFVDIHYQTTSIIGTKSRTPDFYA